MFGLFIAALAAGWMNINGVQGPEILTAVFHGLFYWYAFWGTIGLLFGGFITSMVAVIAGFGVGAKASENGLGGWGVLLAIGAAIGSSLLAVLFVCLMAVSPATLVGGSYLLSTSVTGVGAAAVYDTTRIIIGCIMLFVGIVFRSKSSSSNSSSKKD